MKRPSVIRMKVKMEETQKIMKKMMIRSVGIKVFKVAFVVGILGIGYVGLKKYGANLFQKS
jgi:hypothetical protein